MKFTDKVCHFRYIFQRSFFFRILIEDILLSQQTISMLDPSDIYRPDIASYAEKDVDKFRDYSVVEDDPIKERVRQTYLKMHSNQTVAFVQGIFPFVC